MSEMELTFAHSPDTDDAFMFYGIKENAVQIEGVKITHYLGDIESLNQSAIKGIYPITAISAHIYPYMDDKYYIMKAGASMGKRYGPVLVSEKPMSLKELRGKTIALPGAYTTATLLARIFLPDVRFVQLNFDHILRSIRSGKVDAGIIIHEGQITYEDQGFKKILDFGEVWAKETSNLPLPLGLDVIKKDLDIDLCKKISMLLRDSIKYAYDNIDDAVMYALQFGRGVKLADGKQFVQMYVNDITLDMGETGLSALKKLYELAYKKGIIPKYPTLELV